MTLDLDRHLDRAKRKPGQHTWLARIPFLVFAVGGMVGLIALKYFDINQWAICGVAVALIVVYAVTVANVTSLRIREDHLGDNCYYLGFLYTLTSLGWALYRFAQFNDIADIISNFGLALVSTVIGILLRVVINQARKDDIETERDARMMLTESMVAMRVQLDDAVIALTAFCGQMQQITGDAIRDNTERANSALADAVSKIGDTSNLVLTRIEEAFEEFNENSKKLNQVAAGTVKALEKLVSRLEKMEAPSDVISRRLDGVMESAEKAGKLLRERLEADERAISETAQRMKDMEERLKAAAGWIVSAGSGLDGVAETSRKAVAAAEAAAQKLGNLTEGMTNAISEQERLIAGTRTNAETLNTEILEAQKRFVVQAREGLESFLSALKVHNQAMAAELERARAMSADTGHALADMTEVLTQRVRDIKAARPIGDAAQ